MNRNRKFNLPRKWYLVRDVKNADDVNKWSNDTFYRGRKNSQDNFPANVFSDKGVCSVGVSNYGYTKITTEDFNKNVLNKQSKVSTV